MLRIRNLNNILLRYINFHCEAYEVITEEKKVYFNDIELEVKYSSVEELFIICEKLLDKKKVSFFM